MDAWFEPESFERQPGFYERLGIRTFKRYMPISGDLIYHLIWKKLGAPDLITPNSISSLRSMELVGRLLETVHLMGFAVMASDLGTALANKSITSAAFVAGLNMLVNVYPIMLQRYNRVRLQRTIQKMQLAKFSSPQSSENKVE
ncbi:MAG: glycosyl-4,4'-diaponeurosporenoate acyltransferase CrtO family protein [Aggregatilineales bacterium]